MSVPEYLEFAAPPPLDGLIHCFWFLRGPMGGAAAQPVLPDGRMEIVLHRAEPFAEVDSAGVPRAQSAALLAGQLTRPIHLMPRGDSDVIGIRFHSAGARSLLGFPAAEVGGRVVPLVEVDARLAGALLGASHRGKEAKTQGRDREIVAALAFTLQRFVRREPARLVAEAVRSLERQRSVRVGGLAAQLGVTPRTLERRMLDETGLGPKMLQRILRFRRALALLQRTPRGAWSRAAIMAGYFDQAHLIRDFTRFAGMPPSAYFQADAPLSRAIQGHEAVNGER